MGQLLALLRRWIAPAWLLEDQAAAVPPAPEVQMIDQPPQPPIEFVQPIEPPIDMEDLDGAAVVPQPSLAKSLRGIPEVLHWGG